MPSEREFFDDRRSRMIDEDDEEVEGEVELDLSLELSEATGNQRLERTAHYYTVRYTLLHCSTLPC